MERSDEYLLQSALQGDTASFGELTERWHQRIYAFIRRYVGNSDDARDLTQDTFTKAYRNLNRLSDPARFSSWLYTIALNECRMRFRKKQRAQSLSLTDYEEQGTHTELRAGTATPEAQLATKERVELLKEAFDDLPEEQRIVIVMKEYEGLKFREIAKILDVPLSTVKSRMYLGLKTLKKIMETKL